MKKTLLTICLAAMATTVGAIPVDFDRITHWTGSGPNRAALVILNDAGASDPVHYVWGFRWEDRADGTRPTGEDMFKAICANSSELVLLTQYTGEYGSTVCGIGFGNAATLLDNIYFDFDKAKNFEFINFDYYNSSSLFGQSEAPGDDTPEICSGAIAAARETHVIHHPLDYKTYGYPAYDYDCWMLDDTNTDNVWWSAAWYEGYWSYWTSDINSTDWTYSGTGFSGRQLYDGCIDCWTMTVFEKAMAGGMGEGNPPSDNPELYSYRPANSSTAIRHNASGTCTTDKPEYYTLTGLRTDPDNAKPGIYVVRQGNITRKIIL